MRHAALPSIPTIATFPTRRNAVSGGGVPPVEASTSTLRGVTFDWGVDYPTYVLSNGMIGVVAPGGIAALQEPTPAQTLDGANIINGAVVNPVVAGATQGWDQRRSGWSGGLTHTAWPRACAVGDIIVKAICPNPLVDVRYGVTEYAALVVLASAPGATQEAPAAIGWAGRPTPTPVSIIRSVESVVLPDGHGDLIPVGATVPTYATIMATIDKMAPHTWRETDPGFYEQNSPSLTNGQNYGEDLASAIDFGLIAVSHAAYSYTERVAIGKVLLRHGIQWGDTGLGHGAWPVANGGHYQGHLGAIAFAMWCRGRESEIPGLMDLIPGNYVQAFPLTPAVLDAMVPHGSASGPADYRQRTISARTGSLISVPTLSGDAADVRFTGMTLTKAGVTAPVLDYVLDGAPTLTFNIGTETGGTFAVSDVITYAPPVARTTAEFDFAITGKANLNSWQQSYAAKYRTNISWFGMVLGLAALRILPPDWYAVTGYLNLAMSSNTPAVGFDFPSPTGGVSISGAGAGLLQSLWVSHAASLTARTMLITGKPRFMTTAMWSVAIPGGVDNALDVTISSLPTTGGSAITDVEYTINGGGAWVSLGATSGTVRVTGLAAAATTMALRAVNANGGCPDRSDNKVQTPTGSPPVSNITVEGTATGTNTATMPAHVAGDLILVFSFRDGSSAAPVPPGGYTTLGTAANSTCGHILVYKIAASSGETVGTFTSGTSTIVAVIRGHAGPGTVAIGQNVGTSIEYPTCALTETNGTSWAFGFAATRAIDTAITTAPSGMTNRTSVSDATDQAAMHDTNGGVTSYTGASAAVGGTSAAWKSFTLEVLSS